ncbi:hypothetical protein JOE23_000069 [Amphibacillus cookii]|nr:hypothetical protein [Amphibacillus cookii]
MCRHLWEQLKTHPHKAEHSLPSRLKHKSIFKRNAYINIRFILAEPKNSNDKVEYLIKNISFWHRAFSSMLFFVSWEA